MRLEKYTPNRRGIKQQLGSEGVRAELVRRAHAIADVARAEYEANPPHTGTVEVFVDSQAGGRRIRARAAVIAKHPAVLAIEGDRRTLGAAMDAGRLP
ncbi:hypothetical protein [Roseateles sp.]|uniref:hypothetical protein n=1 Tax=Roseateles sp. TaxID=1971397 RepID=UPI002F42F37B